MATLGKPGLTPLRDRSEVANRIEVIRQRLGALDAEVTRLGQVADSSSSAVSIQSLNQQLRQLTNRVSALEAAAGVTDAVILAASAAVAKFDVVVPSGVNTCAPADPTDRVNSQAAIGVALNAGGIGSPITIQRGGPLTLTISTLVRGLTVYADALGAITQDPGAVQYAIPVGVATSASQIWIGVGLEALNDESVETSDDFLPVTYSLAKTLLGNAQGGDIVLYDDQGRAALASDGGAIITASGA